MRIKRLLLISILIVILIVGIFVHAIYMDDHDWRENGLRYGCLYSVRVTGLSGREAQGTTVIMVPIPASKEGKFFTPPAQKDPYFTQKLLHEVLNWPEETRKGPNFKNVTETFNKKTGVNWTSFIAETEKGHMLGFRTNETKLEDIYFSADIVADYFDVFDPINKGSPILYPVENVSNISVVPYGSYTKYASNPTYDSYVYLSNNLKGGKISFDVYLDAHNDGTEWSEKYRGTYRNEIVANVNDTGSVKVRAILGQIIPDGPDANHTLWDNRYGPVDYVNETDSIKNETSGNLTTKTSLNKSSLP
jgi:hypothetical protein